VTSAHGIAGASGKLHFGDDEPWAMPAPTQVNKAMDGHPSGRHMIDGYRMMAAAARVSGGKYQKEMAEVYDMAALCIENEAMRADRAEALLVTLGSNSAPRPAENSPSVAAKPLPAISLETKNQNARQSRDR
jgi:hypothetical protein